LPASYPESNAYADARAHSHSDLDAVANPFAYTDPIADA
jgi:hypothetical protein